MIPLLLPLVLSMLGDTFPTPGPAFLWRTESITADIRRDDRFLHLGQYLYLAQKLRPHETGWTIMKIDIPERWHVTSVSVASGKVVITLKGGTRYELTRDNVAGLGFAILNGGLKPEPELEHLWDRFALLPPVTPSPSPSVTSSGLGPKR